MVSLDYPIQTPRLRLRPFTNDDLDAVHAYQSRADVCRYIPYSPRTRAEVAERIAVAQGKTTLDNEGDVLQLVVATRADDTVVGDVILFWRSAEHRSGEIGYVLDPAHAGHGYATEAAGALLDIAFDELELHRVIGRIDERNAASAAVLTRLGMRQEARLVDNEWFKGGWSTEIDFAILAAEWRASRA
jgi:RimJ/RimL family protein N-acetyltransferase